MSLNAATILNRIGLNKLSAVRVSSLAVCLLAACSAESPGPSQNGSSGTGGTAGAGTGGTSNPGVGGTAGTLPGTGGSVISGGSGGTGGSVISSGGSAGSGGSGAVVECNITVTSSTLSEKIPTVGIVEFSTDLPGVTSAVIQFGPTTDYGLEAPVDMAAPGYRTLLLGMTQDTTYHYRIVVNGAGTSCASADQEITTGFLPNGGPSNLNPQNGPSTAPVMKGFIITTTGLTGGWIYIMNQDGQLVWSYNTGVSGGGGPGGFNGITRARMSWDGKHMYGRDLNVSGQSGQGKLFKITMDGSSMETFNLSTSHHDFTVTKNNGVAYLAKEGSTGNGMPCDAIWTMNGDGSGKTKVYDLWNALSGFQSQSSLGELCHANAINYIDEDDSFTVSDLYRNVIVKVSASGTLQWTLGGSNGSFSGSGLNWNDQHGHHLFAPDQILIFNNGGQGGPSRVLGFQLDTGSMMATSNFNYEPGPDSGQLGDVQRLPDGSTLVTVSVSGQMHWVDSSGQRIRSFSTNAFGYAEFRTSLYGAPTR